MKIVEKNNTDIYNMLMKYKDQHVCVYQSAEGAKRNDFCSQISVSGDLEKHSEIDQWRVYRDDDTYVYFSSKDVLMIINNPDKGRPNISINVVYVS